jgi:hypothetical protein
MVRYADGCHGRPPHPPTPPAAQASTSNPKCISHLGFFFCGNRSIAIGRGATHVAYRPKANVEVTPRDVRFRRAKRTLTTVAHRDLDFMSTRLVLPDDDLRADVYPSIQVDHIIVDKTKAAG